MSEEQQELRILTPEELPSAWRERVEKERQDLEEKNREWLEGRIPYLNQTLTELEVKREVEFYFHKAPDPALMARHLVSLLSQHYEVYGPFNSHIAIRKKKTSKSTRQLPIPVPGNQEAIDSSQLPIPSGGRVTCVQKEVTITWWDRLWSWVDSMKSR